MSEVAGEVEMKLAEAAESRRVGEREYRWRVTNQLSRGRLSCSAGGVPHVAHTGPPAPGEEAQQGRAGLEGPLRALGPRRRAQGWCLRGGPGLGLLEIGVSQQPQRIWHVVYGEGGDKAVRHLAIHVAGKAQ